MGNVTLPTPVFLAGGAFCLLAGYLVGTVAGPHGPPRSTATVVSFDQGASTLCLQGDSVKNEKSTDSNGVLCGTWSHTPGAQLPDKGDTFRFVTMDIPPNKRAASRTATIIYGTVVQN